MRAVAESHGCPGRIILLYQVSESHLISCFILTAPKAVCAISPHFTEEEIEA